MNGKKKLVVITGMHRSGTSLFTSYLQQCGLYIGESLLPGRKGNERGLFEDTSVLQFHKEILSRTGHGWILADEARPDFKIEPTDSIKIKELIQQLATADVFGFKDPRTTLFLDLWNNAIPEEYEKCYLFLFRKPTAVVDSLLRRGGDPEVNSDSFVGYKCWLLYNRELAKFYKQHSSLCMFISIDEFVKEPHTYIRKINDKFNLNLSTPALSNVFDKNEFKDKPSFVKRITLGLKNIGLYNKCMALYTELKPISG